VLGAVRADVRDRFIEVRHQLDVQIVRQPLIVVLVPVTRWKPC
jgi:hypothetical protein